MISKKLDIKNLTPRKNAATKQGYYKLLNPSKYVGDPSKIIYRSSWEKKFCTFCDINEQVLAWSSETVKVPYVHPFDNLTKIYNVDFYMKVRKPEGVLEYIVEVKPSKKLVKPVAPKTRLNEKRMTAHIEQTKEYLINMHKFSAAKQWAADRGWQFLIVTEKFLF